MSDFNGAVLTKAGLALLAKAQAGDVKLEFTRLAVGTGTYSDADKEQTALYAQTALKKQALSYMPARKEYENEKTVKLTFEIANWSGSEALFQSDLAITELGLFCKAAGDDTSEALYSISVATGDVGYSLPAYTGTNPTEIEQIYYASVDSASNTTISIDPDKVILDDSLNEGSSNGVQNKVVAKAINEINAYLIPSEAGAFGLRYYNGQFQVKGESGWEKAKTVDVTLMSITIDTKPTKTSYKAGETLDTTGIVVTAHFSDASTKDVSSAVTFTPAAGTKLTEDNTKVTVDYTWHSDDLSTDMSASASFDITVQRVLSSIAVTTNPTKTSYYKGDAINYSGMVVTASYTSGNTENVTSACTASPSSGTTLNTIGTQTVTISYTENSVTKTTTTTVSVSVKTVSWSSGTDTEIAAMVEAADAGQIKLSDYWSVGQERKVHLSAMAATGVGESHAAQDVTMVLMNAGGKTDTNGKTVNFIVGQKNGLANGTSGEYGYMNSSNTNSGGWNSCARRTWCNSVYYNALPSTLKGIFKKFKNVTASAGNSSSTTTSEDYFALPSEKEIFGSTTYANATAEASNTQFTYYATAANRIKKCGDSGSADYWWERSPYDSSTNGFCIVYSDGSANATNASGAGLLAPFGCI